MSVFNAFNFLMEHPVNNGAKIRAIFRYLKWHVVSRLMRRPIVFDWISGSKLFVRAGEKGLTGNIYTGLHEFSHMGFLLHALRGEDLFVDVGANSGSYTILASAVVGSQSFAFEPVPSTFERLKNNINLNNLNNRVTAINKAVSDHEGSVALTSDDDTMNRVTLSNDKHDTINIESTTLDASLEQFFPVIAKIDVEGYEFPVLKGACETLKNKTLQALIIELNNSEEKYGYNEQDILDLLYGHGFGSYAYDPLKRELTELKGKDVSSGNTLFIRDRPFIEQRLKTAPKLSIFGCTF